MNPCNTIQLVDDQNNPTQIADKLLAHQKGWLHRAFSVFVFRKTETGFELLLQQRHPDKYHSGNLWTNTCCSHPNVNEQIVQAGERRLTEEMGITVSLTEVGVFHYTADVGNGLIENEIDHVLVGFSNPSTIPFNQQEVATYRWCEISVLQKELREHPTHFTRWFAQAFEHALTDQRFHDTSEALDIQNRIQHYQTRVETALENALSTLGNPPSHLQKAMQYAVLNGGKRIRPLLVYATAHCFTEDLTIADHAAVAVEFIHCYSLIHDDLPAMDDDDLRRGKPSCHKMFDEATAILAGDALQAYSFEQLTSLPAAFSHDLQIRMIQILANSIGPQGMAEGQMQDILAVGKTLELQALETMHAKKTGALITASVLLGALAGQCQDETVLAQLNQFATHIGLAFQIHDDILDIEATTDILGKPQGADRAKQKPTYPALFGIASSKQKMKLLYQAAMDCLTGLNVRIDTLAALADYMVTREY